MNKTLRFLFLFSSLLNNFLICSHIIKETINLQHNERYVLKLEDYYDFTASSVDFPEGQALENTKIPYKEAGSQNNGCIVTSVTSYQESLNSKYFIGYNKVQNGETSFDIQIIYFHLEMNEGILTRTQLASSTLINNCQGNFQISASFYSSISGFISYQSDEFSLTFHFSYSFDKGLDILRINSTLKMVDQLALQRFGHIYIIYVAKEIVGLLKYQTGGNTFQTIDTYIINQGVSSNIVVDPSNCLLGFDSSLAILYSFFIDYTNDKLIISQIALPEFSLRYQAKSIQRYKDTLIITLTKQGRGSNFIILKKQQFIEEGIFQITDTIQTKLQIDYFPVFISDNTLILYNNQSFQMINVETQKVIFQQTLDQDHIVDPKQYIHNQFIVYLTKKDDQVEKITKYYAAELQIPSLVIIGTNQILEFTIFQIDRSFSLIIQIIINVTNDLKTALIRSSIYIQNMITSLNSDIYQIPVERYIKGSNFNPQISVSENNFIKNVQFNRVIQLEQSASVQINEIQSVYQTDGAISSIIINKLGYIFAATPNIMKDQSSEVILYTSSFQPQSQIAIIDNYGSFILQSDLETKNYRIYIPFIDKKRNLYFNTFTSHCSDENFAFASDSQNKVLFVMCGNSIKQSNYEFNPDSAGLLLIITQQNLIFDASPFQKLISIQGNLFIYNKQYISAYDYLSNGFVGNAIIPQLQANQKVILFRQSFIISYSSQEKYTISLYSYGQFQSDQAVFIRNLIQEQLFSLQLSIIPKRNNIEQLYVSTNQQNEYSLFRINNAFSQNQLYTTITIASDKSNVPLISQDLICIIGSSSLVQCQYILKQATLSYQLNLKQSDFYSLLSFRSLITLKFEDQQQVFDLQVIRNASAWDSPLDQQAESIQKLRTEIQDRNFEKGSTFYFKDNQVSKGCNLGWFTYTDHAKIINRLINVESQNRNYIFTILYNQKAVLGTNQIIIGNNLLTLQQDQNVFCTTILDDAASRVQQDSQSFSQNIYVICVYRLYKYTIQFASNKTGDISGATLLDSSSSFLQWDIKTYNFKFKRIISTETGLWLFFPPKSIKYRIIKKENSEVLTIQPEDISLTSELSFNVINSLNLKLSFFRSGLIQVKKLQDGKYIQSFYQIQDMLLRFDFIVNEDDQIGLISQYSDTKFRIQFDYSFIYDITFSIDKNSQLIIDNASLYYYQEAFNSLDSGISSNQYTLLIGKTLSLLNVALYDNQSGIQKQYLIQSTSSINQTFTIEGGLSVTYAEQIKQNEFAIYYNNGGSTNIKISDNVGLVLLNYKSFYEYYNLKIYSKNSINPFHQWISISFPHNSSTPSPLSLKRISFSMSLLFLISLLLI